VLKFHETRHKAREEETAAALERAESEQPAASSDPELRTGT